MKSSAAKPQASSSVDRRARFATGFLLSFPFVFLYTLLLIETKYSVFLNLQPFRIGRPLNPFELAAFVLFIVLEHAVLLATLALICWSLLRNKRSTTPRTIDWLAPVLTLFVYFATVTAQFQVLRYFMDGLDLMLVRQLGGGDFWAALEFVKDELVQLLPVILMGMLVLAAIVFLWIRFGRRLTRYLSQSPLILEWLSARRLIPLNLSLFAASFLIAYSQPVLDKRLSHALVHHFYLFPWKYVTDFDFDGYGLIPKPADHAPFDAALHPYALERIGNGLDENGVGGDLAANVWRSEWEAWEPDLLDRRNVMLIVLESARADLMHAEVDGEPVMPHLQALPGQSLQLIAHTAYTAPALISVFNGVHSRHERRPSLIDRFRTLDYRTGIFSAQNESFSGQDRATGMRQADLFYDAQAEPPEHRMYLSSSEIASALPAKSVVSKFSDWLSAADDRPFFAYLNFQELHYPYSPPAVKNELVDKPIARYAIHSDTAQWLNDTYLNTARAVDRHINEAVRVLRDRGVFEQTLILVIGDHGEELFDHGSLGHGTSISYEQNRPIGKLVNSRWYPPTEEPVGLSEVPRLIHNGLAKDPQHIRKLRGEVLAFLGVRKPIQLALFTRAGMHRYDFRQNRWSAQSNMGQSALPSEPNWHLIHLWESYLLSLRDRQKEE